MTYQQVLYPQLPNRYIATPGPETAGHFGTASAGVAAWPVANRAIYLPVSLPVNAYLSGVSCWCAVTGSANVDLGLYDANAVRLGSLGSTALTVGINTWAPTNPILMQAGLTYYLAMAAVSTSSTFLRYVHNANSMRVGGYAQQASAVPLPNPATFAQVASAYIPVLALSFAGVPA